MLKIEIGDRVIDTSTLQIEIGNRIAMLRNTKGKSQEDLAADLGVSVATMSKIENGHTPIKVEYVMKVAELFHCDVGYIVGEFETEKRAVLDVKAATGLSEASAKKLCDKDTPENKLIDTLLKYDQLSQLAGAIDRYTTNEYKMSNLKKVRNHDALLDAYAHSRETQKHRPVFVRQLAKALNISADMVFEIEDKKKSVLDLSKDEAADFHKYERYKEALYLEYEKINRRAYVSRLLENFVDWIF
jgi:transcriptional regulator with XRE-family HTH domain